MALFGTCCPDESNKTLCWFESNRESSPSKSPDPQSGLFVAVGAVLQNMLDAV